MSKSTTERRVHTRYPRTFEVEPTDPAEPARMVATNLSLGGLYCTSARGFDEMTRLAVRLLLPSGNGDATEPLDVDAVVVRRRVLNSSSGGARFELALFFTDLDDEQRRRIAEHLAD